MEMETYNLLTLILGTGAYVALAGAVWQLAAAIPGWRGPYRKRRLARFAALAVAVPALVGTQQWLLWRVYLPSLGHEARAERRARYDEAAFVKVGQHAPAFAVETDDGGEFALDKLRGKVVVVNFLATWCGPCLMELPHVEALWQRYRGRKDFALLVVGREETPHSVAAFKAEHGFTFPMAADPQRAVYGLFAKEFIPRTYVISPEGTIRFACTGYDEQEFAELKEEIAGQLAEKNTGRDEPMRASTFAGILKDLRGDDPATREQAVASLEAVSKQGLDIEDGIKALEAAAEGLPVDDMADACRALVAAALVRPYPIYKEMIVDRFSQYSEGARWRFVRWLNDEADAPAARTYLELVERYAPGGHLPSAPLSGFLDSPEALRVLVPTLLEHSGVDSLGYQMQHLVLRAIEDEKMPASCLANFTGSVLEMYEPLRDRGRRREPPTGDDWIWSDDNADDRAHVALLLDLMGYMRGEAVVEALEEALTSRDPRVRHFAALSLVRQGQIVPKSVIEQIAECPEVRNWLYDGLVALARRDLFPDRFASQEALAEGSMVDWLIFPTELGRAPHEIELMATFDDEEGEERYYLFRFRTEEPHWAADDGWMAGVAGPFEIEGGPYTFASDTFSTFTKWDEATPRDHLEAITGVVSKAQQRQLGKTDDDGDE